VCAYEPVDAWSVEHLVRDHGEAALEMTRAAYPSLNVRRYELESLDLDEALDGADLVLVHERNAADLVRWIGARRRNAGAKFKLLFHDTHHRSVTDPRSMSYYELEDFDGVLAFAEAIRDVYARRGWARRAFVWREAADVRLFRPVPPDSGRRGDVVWMGNWDDEVRSQEFEELFLDPVHELGLVARIHGTRYPESAVAELVRRGVDFRGWLPNFRVPYVYAQYTMTVHVPRGPYLHALPGIPTIGVFEALACGTPLIVGRWQDNEQIFRPGEDFLLAKDPEQMKSHMRLLLRDGDARWELARSGRDRIMERHTCGHRVDELYAIARALETRDDGRQDSQRAAG
jgi:spore maturation protein CgeB